MYTKHTEDHVKMRRKYIHVKVLEKAKMLVRNDRVELLDNGRYNVIGDHGTYNVVETPKGQMVCSCPGYRDKGSCSHSTAVEMITRRKVKR